jgi:hypothetical protein
MTNTDEQARIEGLILWQIYEPFFMSFDGANLRDWREGQGFNKITFDNTLSRMSGAI